MRMKWVLAGVRASVQVVKERGLAGGRGKGVTLGDLRKPEPSICELSLRSSERGRQGVRGGPALNEQGMEEKAKGVG